ncbi:ZapG family protein [Candidatus Curculioniphilus buchneri]|uniref:ZapG family protein n=1 Tax=Candidatus Curculioniphilus buchneri TaxID=690594 RepID=UPI00376ECA24
MFWKYVLIGLILGIITSVISVSFSNYKLRRQQRFQKKLEKNMVELDEYRKELTNLVSRSIEILESIIADYRKLYKDIDNNANNLLLDKHVKENFFLHRLTESESDNDQIPTEIRLRDNP